MAVETALGAEMEAHLGYKPNEKSQSRRSNHRNGSSKKRLKIALHSTRAVWMELAVYIRPILLKNSCL